MVDEMIQRQKDAVCALGIVFSVKHPLFAMLGAVTVSGSRITWCAMIFGPG